MVYDEENRLQKHQGAGVITIYLYEWRQRKRLENELLEIAENERRQLEQERRQLCGTQGLAGAELSGAVHHLESLGGRRSRSDCRLQRCLVWGRMPHRRDISHAR